VIKTCHFFNEGYIKLVVEHILVLSQLLEPYNENEALSLKDTTKSQIENLISMSFTHTQDSNSSSSSSLSTTSPQQVILLSSRTSTSVSEASEIDVLTSQFPNQIHSNNADSSSPSTISQALYVLILIFDFHFRSILLTN
jgi:hypothetical protein